MRTCCLGNCPRNALACTGCLCLANSRELKDASHKVSILINGTEILKTLIFRPHDLRELTASILQLQLCRVPGNRQDVSIDLCLLHRRGRIKFLIFVMWTKRGLSLGQICSYCSVAILAQATQAQEYSVSVIEARASVRIMSLVRMCCNYV